MVALMGNLASASNSIATMVSHDVVERFRPQTNQLVVVGNYKVLALLVFAAMSALYFVFR
jgi:hypothetical protein